VASVSSLCELDTLEVLLLPPPPFEDLFPFEELPLFPITSLRERKKKEKKKREKKEKKETKKQYKQAYHSY
jgi:hypothetical protein